MYAYILDILLLFVSGFACLYCVLLSRRLKKLQNLDGGLGASILSLTEAITKTNKAALEARLSTEHSVTELKRLLRSGEDILPQIEARLESLRNAQNAADSRFAALDEILTTEIDPAIRKAQQSSRSLLQTIRVVMAYERRANTSQIAHNAHSQSMSQVQRTNTTQINQGQAA